MKDQKGITITSIVMIILAIAILGIAAAWFMIRDGDSNANITTANTNTAANANVTISTNTNITTNINSASNVNSATNVNTAANINTAVNTNTTTNIEILPDYCVTNDDCGTGGCNNEVCDTIADAEQANTTCEAQEWHQCIDLTTCGCNNNRCSWEQNDEYLNCMDEYAP